VGKKVAVHATGGEGALVSAQAGVYSIEHGYYLDDKTLLLMKQKGIYLVPTFSVTEWNVAHAATPAAQVRGKIVLQLRHKHFESALAVGVKIAMGSDVGPFPHGTQAEEFSWMVKYGMTPLASIQAGTINAAALMGWSADVGSIEAGKLADLVAVADNPLQNIDILKQTLFVMKGGVVVKNLVSADKH
jgi:imidazolonepropionase-like amidohydrolase